VKTTIVACIGCLSVLLILEGPAFGQTAQEAHVSGSPNPVGSGARALGMGGAFIGVADDATAASWNPGGLIQLETPEVSMVLSAERLIEERSFKDNPGASGEYHVTKFDINYLSIAYPFRWLNRNMIVSLNYQTLYDFNKTYNYHYRYRSIITSMTETSLVTIDSEIDTSGPRRTVLETEGYLKALSPAIAIQVTPTFSLGFTLNYFHPELDCEWETNYKDNFQGLNRITIITNTKPPLSPATTTTITDYSVSLATYYHDEFEFKSSLNPLDIFRKKTSFNIGFLWSLNRYLTLGGVYKAPFKAKVRYRESYGYVQDMENVADPGDSVHISEPLIAIADEEQEMEMPASYGLGLACRFSDLFSMDLDIYRTEWQNFLLRQASGRELSLITGRELSKSNTEPTHQVRLGAEYLFMIKNRYIVPVRGGLFYDPEPTEARPDAFYGLSLGSGITVGSYVFDLAYQYRWGDGVRKVRLGQEEIFQDVKQHTLYASLIYHF
jgi:long-subunit fatty acid transport protein